MSRTSKYYIPRTIERAEAQLAELYLLRDIAALDRKINLLNALMMESTGQQPRQIEGGAGGNGGRSSTVDLSLPKDMKHWTAAQQQLDEADQHQ